VVISAEREIVRMEDSRLKDDVPVLSGLDDEPAIQEFFEHQLTIAKGAGAHPVRPTGRQHA
jgi:hypothetical protein